MSIFFISQEKNLTHIKNKNTFIFLLRIFVILDIFLYETNIRNNI